MTTSLVALHVAAHAKGLAATDVRAAEGLLARVAVRVDAQAGGAREGLVAGAADIPVVVLLVGGGVGGREVVMVLPGRGDGRDDRLVGGGGGHGSSRGRGGTLVVGRGGSLVVHGGGGGLHGRGVRGDTGSGRGVGPAGDVLDGALAGDGGALGRAGQGHGGLRVGLQLDGRGGGCGGRVAVAVEARVRTQRGSGRHVGRQSVQGDGVILRPGVGLSARGRS